jgi:lipoprotein-anchoring transpeptidase ErfK/SrfK
MDIARRSFLLAAAGAVSLVALPAAAQDAGVPAAGRWEARVSIDEQRMRLYHDGNLHAEWPVSTARKGRVTPKGTFKPYWLSKHHRSSRYNNAPMPFAVFYDGNYAVHGTDQIEKLGTRASAGCVRLHPDNAAFVFAIAQTHGLDALRIVIS